EAGRPPGWRADVDARLPRTHDPRRTQPRGRSTLHRGEPGESGAGAGLPGLSLLGRDLGGVASSRSRLPPLPQGGNNLPSSAAASHLCSCLPPVQLPATCAAACLLCSCLPPVQLPASCAAACLLCSCLPPV